MSDRIDAELERIKKLGQTAKVIRVGDKLHSDLEDELNHYALKVHRFPQD